MAVKPVVAVVATRVISLFTLSILAIGQINGQTQTSKKKPVEIDVLYSYYTQDGNNSAVTGGTGTEELSYHAPSIILHIPTDSVSQIDLKMGVDIYSSASQDNIDFNVSSASRKDARTYLSIGYQKEQPKQESSYGFHGSSSVESDYLSFGLGGFYSKGWFNYNTVFTTAGQVYFDDCRWGWLSTTEGRELQLIYPEELRYKEWETQYKRYTTSLSLSLTQLITKRINIGLFADAVWQTGLLSTTFHRVYFKDAADHAIEKLPYDRWKIPIALRLNYFANPHVLLRGYYRYYADSWGIQAHSFEVESSIKLSAFLSIFPFYRYHIQGGAYWFNPYGIHSVQQDYYTSDYDLATFTAHKFGIGFNWNPVRSIARFSSHSAYGWQAIQFRIGSYVRSNGLTAYFFSTAFHLGD